MYSIGQFAKKVGKTVETIRIWERKGILAPAYRSQGGHRMYSEEQLAQALQKDQPKNRINIGYVCVDSHHQKDDLLRQEQLIESYLALQGKPYQIITDIGSGINYKKQGLKQLLFTIISNQVETIYVLHKDRLLRFGFELLEEVCRLHNTKIEIINQSEEETSEKELVEEMMKNRSSASGWNSPDSIVERTVKKPSTADSSGKKPVKRFLYLLNRLWTKRSPFPVRKNRRFRVIYWRRSFLKAAGPGSGVAGGKATGFRS